MLLGIEWLSELTMDHGLIKMRSLQGVEENRGNPDSRRSTARLGIELGTLYINRTVLALSDVE